MESSLGSIVNMTAAEKEIKVQSIMQYFNASGADIEQFVRQQVDDAIKKAPMVHAVSGLINISRDCADKYK